MEAAVGEINNNGITPPPPVGAGAGRLVSHAAAVTAADAVQQPKVGIKRNIEEKKTEKLGLSTTVYNTKINPEESTLLLLFYPAAATSTAIRRHHRWCCCSCAAAALLLSAGAAALLLSTVCVAVWRPKSVQPLHQQNT